MQELASDSASEEVEFHLVLLRNSNQNDEERRNSLDAIHRFLDRELAGSAEVVAFLRGGNCFDPKEVINEMWVKLEKQLIKTEGHRLKGENHLRRYATKILYQVFTQKAFHRLNLMAEGHDPAASQLSESSRLAAKDLWKRFRDAMAWLEKVNPDMAAVVQARILVNAGTRFSELGSRHSRLGEDVLLDEARTQKEIAAILDRSEDHVQDLYDRARAVIDDKFPGLLPRLPKTKG